MTRTNRQRWAAANNQGLNATQRSCGLTVVVWLCRERVWNDIYTQAVQMNMEADRTLLKYFSENLPIVENWFNVISPAKKSLTA